MSDFDPANHPHRRYNPLTGEHVLVSPHRANRPWLGHVELPEAPNLPTYDPKCYLCPGNHRTSGQSNPAYAQCFSFPNDFAAVLSTPAPQIPGSPHPLLATEPVRGKCDVIVYHPRHDLTMARLDTSDIANIIEEWIRLYTERGTESDIGYVQIFENKGAIMGCSNPHPHGQAWSTSAIPSIPATELASLLAYSQSEATSASANFPKGPNGKPCLLCDYVHFEVNTEDRPRVVTINEHWVALVPWWAIWPFEILLLPFKRHIPSLLFLTLEEKSSFANILSEMTIRYDNLFSCSFAYSMGIHQQAVPSRSHEMTAAGGASELSAADNDIAHIHLHFAPPLLRSATVRKFLVGYELMAEPQRDLTPEQAASRLRNCSTVHYLEKSVEEVEKDE